jgi:hypothetical protein
MRRYGSRLVLSFSFAVIGVLATTAVTAPVATASTSAAITTAKVKAAGISVAYPRAWTTVPASTAAINDMIKALEKKNPKAAATLENATKNGLSKQVKLFAIDVARSTGNNVNVIAAGSGNLPGSVADFQSGIEAEYKSLNATVDGASTAKVSGTTAYRANISFPLTLDDGTSTMLRLGQLFVDTPKGIAVVTVTVAADDPTGSHTIDTVLSSVTIL